MADKKELRERSEEYAQIIRRRLNLASPLCMIDVATKFGVKCCPERQQFSIAHELGHLLLHRLNTDAQPNVYHRGGANSSPQIEWEANEFAAALSVEMMLTLTIELI